jgi:hypothetical protein
LTMQFLGPGGDTPLYCYVHELHDGQRMRQEKLAVGEHCASATATAMCQESSKAPSWPAPPERLADGRRVMAERRRPGSY